MPGQIPTNPYDPNQFNRPPTVTGDQIDYALDVLKRAKNEIGQMGSPQYSGNIPPSNVPQYKTPPPAPKSDISAPAPQYQDFDAQRAADPANQVPMGEDQAAMSPVAAQETVGEDAKTQVLQPGNRRSIKEYLAQIKALREQMRAQGVPEDQLPVPTFSNIQGGQMDQTQGYLGPGEGQAGPPQEVRSYVTPEWQAPAGDAGGVPTQMGPAHPIQQQLDQIKAQSPQVQQLKGVLQNDMDPRWSMAVAFDTIDDWMIQFYDQNGRYPNEQEVGNALQSLRNQAFKAQGENIAKYQKMFPGSDQESLWKAFRTGNWAEVSKRGNDMLSDEKVGKVMDESRKRWDEMRDKNNAAPLDDDGNPFPSQEAYVQYKVQQYQEMITNMVKAAQSQGSTGGPQTPQGSTGGPQNKSTGFAATPGGELGAMAGRKMEAGAREYKAPNKMDDAKKYYQDLIRQGVKDKEAQAKTRAKFGK